MKSYLEQLIESVENTVDTSVMPQTKQSIQKAKEVLNDPKFILQKGVRSLVDEDARVGYKSKTDSFFGYKVEYVMIPEERIITAVGVQNGAYVDGTEFEKLYQQTKASGVEITEAYGDKAYFRKSILDILKEDEVQAIIPVSETAYRVDESRFKYNKDSDQWFCEHGNYTWTQRKITVKDGRQFLEYKFEKEICRDCPNRKECINGSSIAKRLILGLNAPEFYEYSQRAKTPEFLEKYKKRASHEWKNGEMKRFHGLGRARGYGLKSMATQAKLTALAVNLKRIASLVSSLNNIINCYFINSYRMIITYSNCKKSAA
ncbi:MAG: transposase [Firmicutes bacterium]|nr:transposase [Bacillota bacterium]